MKNFYLSFYLLFLGLGVSAQIITIPDTNLKAMLLSSTSSNQIARNSIGWAVAVDTNNDGQIQLSEALNIAELNVSTNVYNTTNDIHDLNGIENFTNLKVLNCAGNQISSINIAPLTQLQELIANDNLFTNVTVSGLNSLRKLNFNHNDLTTINTDNLTNLVQLWVYDNHLTSISFNNNPLLENIDVTQNLLTGLDLSILPSLIYGYCIDNQLSLLNLTGLVNLRSLMCSGNQLVNINLSSLSSLQYLNASSNPLNAINVNGLANLNYLELNNTSIAMIDCSQSSVLNLYAMNCPNLQTINVRNGVYSSSDPDLLFYAFRIENNPNLVSICTDDGEQNQLVFTNYNTSGNVIVYNGGNCDIPVQVNMGVNDFNKQQITIYPNPTSGIVNIMISNDQPIYKTTVTNILGQTTMLYGNTTTLDISSLSKGTYFITVETDSGKETQKIIKF
ncbi:T9SS type A sorting domain-containing protein [Flavobacterium sp. N1994]|uniref:T9SS type A sorting domain-containing protein n=1 Tax=Flavobacterium sp. N1994 TaxID=2986827 RepID=UPI002223761B|nr:T9SS type A sorting domain-containing protein [Flavobacterium sp. N1994]